MRPSGLGGLEVDDKLECSGLLDGQLGRPPTPENASRINANLAIGVVDVGSVAHQATGFDVVAHRERRRDRIARRQDGQLDPSAVEKGIGADEECVGPLPRERREGLIDLLAIGGMNDIGFQPKRASGRLLSLSGLPLRFVARIDECRHTHCGG